MSLPVEESAPVTESRLGVTGLATVAGTSGVGVRCRVKSSVKSSVIAVIEEGATVELRGIARGAWQPVFCGGQPGFVMSKYVAVQAGTLSAAAEAPLAVGGQVFSVAAEQILVVTGTGGGGLRCRAAANTSAAVITIMAEGAKVNARGPESNGWYPVICGNKNGFANAAFLKAPAASSPVSGGTVITAENGTATVKGSGGGLRCRTNPNTDAQVITVLTDGTTVTLRGARSGDWQPVVCANRNGWVAAQYLAYSSTTADTPATSFKKGDALVVKGTNGDGVRMRSTASDTGTVLIVVPEGAAVTVRNGSTGNWVAVTYSGKNGFIHKDYVGKSTVTAPTATATPARTATATATATAAATSGYAVGTKLVISGTGGTGVRLRSAASSSASVVSVVPEGAEATVRAGSTATWVAVTVGAVSGFIHKDFLKPATTTAAPSTSPTAAPTQVAGSGLVSGDRAKVTSTLNMRLSASFSAGVAAVAQAGTVVLVTGSISGDFYPVDWAGLRGFMHKDYLTKTSDALSPRNVDTPTTPVQKTTGEKMVDFAMQYLGYPYVWATSGPNSFDCSGFTYWVVKNIVGSDIGRSTSSQVASGTSVDRGSLQIGDLVFFQNTYTFGLSHVGIYIGNGQFIHAENSGTGVVISSLDSPYYATRWYGAVRVA
jgi:cell wall-associated NlpC family hydrolase